jgi:hypothetical protein
MRGHDPRAGSFTGDDMRAETESTSEPICLAP